MMPDTLDVPPTMQSLLTAIDLNKKEHNVFILYYFSQFLNTFFIKALQQGISVHYRICKQMHGTSLQGRSSAWDDLVSVILHMRLFGTPFVSDPIIDLGNSLL